MGKGKEAKINQSTVLIYCFFNEKFTKMEAKNGLSQTARQDAENQDKSGHLVSLSSFPGSSAMLEIVLLPSLSSLPLNRPELSASQAGGS